MPDAEARRVCHRVYATSISAGATIARASGSPSGGSVDSRDAPAAVQQRAAERRPRRHVADEVERRRDRWPILPTVIDFAFATGQNRLERDVALEHAPAARVHVTDGGADLRVAVGGEIFHHEIDQPPVALQEGQHLDGALRGVARDGLSRRLGGRGRSASAAGSRPLNRIEKNATNASLIRVHTRPSHAPVLDCDTWTSRAKPLSAKRSELTSVAQP